jgi:hypothetical protein
MNISLRNPGAFANHTYSDGEAITINSFYYDVLTDGIYAKQIIENSGFPEPMRIMPDGIVYLKGVKQINASFSKKFELTTAGNLIAKSFTSQY